MPKKYTQEEIEEAAKELEILENDSVLNGDGVYICSDGTKVNIKSSPVNLKTRTLHLSQEEVESVLVRYREVKKKISRRTILRRIVKGEPVYIANQDWPKALARSGELLDLFGKLYSAVEVHKIVTNEWGLVAVKYEHLTKFQRENSETIHKMKDDYQKDVSSLRLVHKRSRLDELTDMYHSRKEKYEFSGTRSDYELMLKTLEQIRKEVEGSQLTINGSIRIEHEMVIQDHINTEILKTLNINDIIISRLCARMKTSPKYLMWRLHNSYYKKFTGFLPEEMDTSSQIIYPSQMVYDFDRLAVLNKEIEAEDIEYREVEEEEVTQKTTLMRQLLMKKLAEKKKSIDSQQNRAGSTDGKKT